MQKVTLLKILFFCHWLQSQKWRHSGNCDNEVIELDVHGDNGFEDNDENVEDMVHSLVTQHHQWQGQCHSAQCQCHSGTMQLNLWVLHNHRNHALENWEITLKMTVPKFMVLIVCIWINSVLSSVLWWSHFSLTLWRKGCPTNLWILKTNIQLWLWPHDSSSQLIDSWNQDWTLIGLKSFTFLGMCEDDWTQDSSLKMEVKCAKSLTLQLQFALEIFWNFQCFSLVTQLESTEKSSLESLDLFWLSGTASWKQSFIRGSSLRMWKKWNLLMKQMFPWHMNLTLLAPPTCLVKLLLLPMRFWKFTWNWEKTCQTEGDSKLQIFFDASQCQEEILDFNWKTLPNVATLDQFEIL